jgi:hypothetical protein
LVIGHWLFEIREFPAWQSFIRRVCHWLLPVLCRSFGEIFHEGRGNGESASWLFWVLPKTQERHWLLPMAHENAGRHALPRFQEISAVCEYCLDEHRAVGCDKTISSRVRE